MNTIQHQVNAAVLKALLIAAVLAGLLLWAFCPQLHADERPTVTIVVHDFAHVPPATMVKAREVASAILRGAGDGIELRWLGPSEYARLTPADPVEAHTFASSTVGVSILPFSMLSGREDVLGGAILNTRRAWAAYPRIVSHAREADIDPGTALGAVLAHEIGHVFVGRLHTAGGVMRKSLDLASLSRGLPAGEAGMIRAAVEGGPGRTP